VAQSDVQAADGRCAPEALDRLVALADEFDGVGLRGR